MMSAHLIHHALPNCGRNRSVYPFGCSLEYRVIIDALQQIKLAKDHNNIAVSLIYTTKDGIMVNILKFSCGFYFASRGNEEYLL